jgi:hypothetical protein
LAALLLCTLAGPGLAWSEFGTEDKPEDPTDGPAIREPFFEFLLTAAEADSLGTWSAADLAGFLERSGRESRFPLEEIITVSRLRPEPGREYRYPGAVVRAVWRLELTGDLDKAMPYSILGYHPGSLRIGENLVFAELAPQDLNLSWVQDDQVASLMVTDYRVFALEEGPVLLDADGWLDALLGSGLDDAWIVGFVTAREEGKLVGLGVSLGRDGRRIYGEFDFTRDAILPNGRPAAAAMSRASRSWLDPARHDLPEPWSTD